MNGVPRGWPTFVRSARQLRWANSGEIPREMDKPKGAARKGWETGLHDGTTVEDHEGISPLAGDSQFAEGRCPESLRRVWVHTPGNKYGA